MENQDFDRKEHWEKIYQTKELNEVSWYQPKPETSLDFFREFNVPINAKIIDIGGGDSLLVDCLLDLGYTDITILDISENAIERAKKRLNEKASKVKWIIADAADFKPLEKYDFWHDRAAFHFLTEENEIQKYLHTAQNFINPTGVMVIGTFSKLGPTKCSGIEIKQYSEESMDERLNTHFNKVKCVSVNHETPFNTVQSFIFCSFRKT